MEYGASGKARSQAKRPTCRVYRALHGPKEKKRTPKVKRKKEISEYSPEGWRLPRLVVCSSRVTDSRARPHFPCRICGAGLASVPRTANPKAPLAARSPVGVVLQAACGEQSRGDRRAGPIQIQLVDAAAGHGGRRGTCDTSGAATCAPQSAGDRVMPHRHDTASRPGPYPMKPFFTVPTDGGGDVSPARRDTEPRRTPKLSQRRLPEGRGRDAGWYIYRHTTARVRALGTCPMPNTWRRPPETSGSGGPTTRPRSLPVRVRANAARRERRGSAVVLPPSRTRRFDQVTHVAGAGAGGWLVGSSLFHLLFYWSISLLVRIRRFSNGRGGQFSLSLFEIGEFPNQVGPLGPSLPRIY